MKPTLRILALAALVLSLLAGGSSPAHAQVDGPQVQLGLGVGGIWFEQWLGIADGTAWAARLGYHPRAAWGLELQADYASTGASDGADSTSSTFGFYAIGARYEFLPFQLASPYVSASVGYARYILPGPEWHGGVGLGLTVGVNWRFYSNGVVFTEVKDDLASVNGSLTHQIFATVGLRFAFGTNADHDMDGVSDGRDQCPDTPRGAVVDPTGCPSDPDGDGVPDGLDDCPGTPAGTPVDEHGCPIHRDRAQIEG